MTVHLNRSALTNARSLVKAGKVVRDEPGDWSADAPSADDENDFIDDSSYADYAKWHLGIDDDAPRETKGHYKFPFGDFAKVHRCGVIAIESRAAQNDYDDIAKAAKNLLTLIDEG